MLNLAVYVTTIDSIGVKKNAASQIFGSLTKTITFEGGRPVV